MSVRNRRDFLAKVGMLLGAGGMVYLGGGLIRPTATYAADGNLDVCFDGKCGRKIYGETLPHDRLAKYWTPIGGDRIHCMLCPYHCILAEGERCRCQAKENSGGQLYDMVYGYVATLHLDRVEKLPIYHRYPGMLTLALGTAGCGLHCKYCQNWQLSQVPPEKTENYRLMPDDVISLARQHGAGAIALAYTEPLTFFEYSLDLAKAARKAGLKVFMGTGGFCCPEPVAELAPHIDAVAFGLKGFSDTFYNEIVGPGVKLDHILASLEAFKAAGTHIEVVNLVVPTKNDTADHLQPLARYVHDTLGADTPLHFLKFFPHYQLKQLPPTGQKSLETAAKAARDTGLKHVYIGNLPGHSGNNTWCPHCGTLAIQRIGFRVLAINIDKQGICTSCGGRIPGDFSLQTVTK